ncbi:MAG: SUMF1/EgtB/PvdO family nonheme iron enzyme, partial [bacterium]
AELVKDHILGLSVLTSDSLLRADANQNDKIDVGDLVYVFNNLSPQTRTIYLPGNVPLELVRIPSGSFQMGSPDTERSRYSDEGPVHTVTINYSFYMGRTEVTQCQWLAVMGSWPDPTYYPRNPYGVGDNYPAYHISWNDAQNFITALGNHIASSGQGPLTVRLPSEAEWEYACRGGTQTRFFFGDSLSVGDLCEDDGIRSQYMWYCGNDTPYGTKEVATKLPNQFGLYDMSGNVWGVVSGLVSQQLHRSADRWKCLEHGISPVAHPGLPRRRLGVRRAELPFCVPHRVRPRRQQPRLRVSVGYFSLNRNHTLSLVLQ